MQQVSDTRLEEFMQQLNTITNRRNELLSEMYQIMRWRKNNRTILDVQEGIDNHLDTFLRTFNLDQANPDFGSIINFSEPDFHLPFSNINVSLDSPSKSKDNAVRRSTRRSARSSEPADGSSAGSSQVISPREREEEYSTVDQAEHSQSPVDTQDAKLEAQTQPRPSSVTSKHIHITDDVDELDLLNGPLGPDYDEKHLSSDEEVDMDVEPHNIVPTTAISILPGSNTQPSSDFRLAMGRASDASYGWATELPATYQDHLSTAVKVEDAAVDTLLSSKDLFHAEEPDVEEDKAYSAPSPALGRDGPSKAQEGKDVALLPSSPSALSDITQTVTSSQKPVIIPLPQTPYAPTIFDFNVELRHPQPGFVVPRHRHESKVEYALPSIKSLPLEHSRKMRAKQTRKREREREKGDGKKEYSKDDWYPLGANRWAATINANPAWKKVSRASKCLSSKDWTTAMSEIRLMRAFDRIENLKREGLWSFRQPKKQRGVGGITKTHWDYLMDEMKWMRIDFREERKWKIAMAFKLSTAVLEWHSVSDPTERIVKGICIKLGPIIPLKPTAATQEHKGNRVHNDQMVAKSISEGPSKSSLLDIDYASDDDNDEDQQTTQTVPITPHVETSTEAFEPSSESQTPASKATPNSSNGDDLASSKLIKASTSNPLRAAIAYLNPDVLFLDDKAIGIRSPREAESAQAAVQDIATIFPDLQPLQLLDMTSTSMQVTIDGKKRLEKISDRHDPQKRAEDTISTKLYPVGNFMSSKPTLLGSLIPSKYWKNGSWSDLDVSPVVAEADPKSMDEVSNELFDSRSSNSPSSVLTLQMQAALLKDRDPRRRASEHVWSPSDDNLLKSLIDRYPNNWILIAECFNASRLTIAVDRRTPRDCLERWKEKWGPDIRTKPVDTAQGVEDSSPSQMMTRGVKRLASTSLSASSPAGVLGAWDARKRRRHLLLQDAIRKAGKKRVEHAQKMLAPQRKVSAIHETHTQFNKMPKLSPAELSRMKAEREAREMQELQMARRRQDELSRQIRDQSHRMNVPQQVLQQQLASAGQRPTAGLPQSQSIPQIRTQVNISQQQRIGAPSVVVGNARLPNQQILQHARMHQQPQQTPTPPAHVQQQAQVQGITNGITLPTEMAGVPHVGSPFGNRDSIASAQLSPGQAATTSPSNSSMTSRPASTQPHPVIPAIQIPNSGTRPTNNTVTNFPLNMQSFTQEQLHAALRLQLQQSPPQPANGNFASQS